LFAKYKIACLFIMHYHVFFLNVRHVLMYLYIIVEEQYLHVIIMTIWELADSNRIEKWRRLWKFACLLKFKLSINIINTRFPLNIRLNL